MIFTVEPSSFTELAMHINANGNLVCTMTGAPEATRARVHALTELLNKASAMHQTALPVTTGEGDPNAMAESAAALAQAAVDFMSALGAKQIDLPGVGDQ